MKGLCLKGYIFIIFILNCTMAYCLYAALFLCNATWEYRPIILFIGILIYLLLLLAVYDIAGRIPEKKLKYIAVGMMAFMVVGMLCIGKQSQSVRQRDLFNLHYAAIYYLENGTLGNMDYFSVYPFQRNYTYILIGIYKLGSMLGIADYRTSGTIFGAIMIFLSGIFLYASACRLKGKRLGICALALFITNPVMYLYAGYYYNDLAAMPIFIGIIYLALMVEKCQKKERLVIFFLMGFLTHIGLKIRPVIGIAGISILLCLWMFWDIQWKERVKYTISFAAGIIPSYIIWDIMTREMGGSLNADLTYPVTHCLMMGMNLNGLGRWQYEMQEYTESFPTYAEKISGNIVQLSAEIKEMGISGLCKLFLIKLRTIWSDGYTMIRSVFWLVARYGKLYEYTAGSKRFITCYLTQIMRCVVLICLFPALRFFKRHRSSMAKAIPILMFGYVLFFLFWEVQERYILMFLPVLFLIAAAGVGQLYHQIFAVLYTFEKMDCIRRIVWKTGIAMLIITSLCALCYRGDMIGTPCDLYDARLQQPKVQGNILLSRQPITQTFVLDKEFNTISIQFVKDNVVPDGQKYQFILENDGNIICEQDFYTENIKNNANYTFSFDMVVPQTNVEYIIRLNAMDNYEKNIGVCHANPNINASGDHYDYGECIVDGNVVGDMTFSVSKHIKSETFMKKTVFYMLVFGSLILEIALFCYVYGMFLRNSSQKNK